MEDFIISTDDTCDLPEEYIKENGLNYIRMTYTLENKEYTGGPGSLKPHEFYDKMRNGAMPKTAQITPDGAYQSLEPFMEKGVDVLHFTFSSALSGTSDSYFIAAKQLEEKYPERKIIVVDTLSASLGEGLMVDCAVELKKQGKSMEEIRGYIEENKQKFLHYFTVDDLFHLHRGGRVSKMTAVLGSMLGIKPVLHVSSEGKLIPIAKARGRKKSLDMLVDKMVQRMDKDLCNKFFVSHGDCLGDAEYVAQKVMERANITNYMINYIGPIIGTHSGPGTVALFFVGDSRTEN